MQTVPGKEFRVESPYVTSKQKSSLSMRAAPRGNRKQPSAVPLPPLPKQWAQKQNNTGKMEIWKRQKKGKKASEPIVIKIDPIYKTTTITHAWIRRGYDHIMNGRDTHTNRDAKIENSELANENINGETKTTDDMPQIVTFARARKHYNVRFSSPIANLFKHSSRQKTRFTTPQWNEKPGTRSTQEKNGQNTKTLDINARNLCTLCARRAQPARTFQL